MYFTHSILESSDKTARGWKEKETFLQAFADRNAQFARWSKYKAQRTEYLTFWRTLPCLLRTCCLTGSIEEPFKATFVRYKLWNTPRFPHVQPCDGRWVRHICHFAPGDLPRMIASSKLFANKFSYDYMPAAYDCLEEWYWHRVHLENSGRALPLNLSVYATSNLVTHRYTGPVRVWD
ncbi:hypothetical protein C0Q70_19722 [Pomacea canaliculata]|uniref:Uncharacterized protein n=1 Tax=Pomacea canaliculata TaxID=400727 RepID=A0A2T7NDI8_POMCA|nr:hypothetical protein C0Q70_19722 [Pomacea canaliculata]